ncbi:MAG: nucleotidyltransferase [SAR324 cluster bacterium]|uniref:Nucleotidyltransferase n=1 Tax=SAR324 cluster bacterium TaxID=2024889 RepID=A0A2A4T4I9_9DELT|nr:MAG: nucleotidyltransferase [SAR324 cluster bacterium]
MTEKTEDVRWEQRFKNYQKALSQLRKFIEKGDLSDLEEQGLIKAFEYTYELAWNTLKDFLEYQGQTELYGSRDTIRSAFKLALIQDGESWMDMLKSRNKTSHTYNEETAKEISEAVTKVYYLLFTQLEEKFKDLRSNLDGTTFSRE